MARVILAIFHFLVPLLALILDFPSRMKALNDFVLLPKDTC
jgi:hypothetical protein